MGTAGPGEVRLWVQEGGHWSRRGGERMAEAFGRSRWPHVFFLSLSPPTSQGGGERESRVKGQKRIIRRGEARVLFQ